MKKKFLDLLKRFERDERGAFLAMFGVLAVVLIATAGATVDFTSIQNARTRAQAALDAAALALQPEIYKTTYATEALMEAAVKTRAKDLLIDRLNDSKITITTPPDLVADGDKDAGTLTLTVTLKAPLYFVSLIGISTMNMTITSQATKGSQDLEVAVALDVTGSMQTDDKIDALIDAANDMVDILVLDQQEPTYTKMALVPWSSGVNLGANAVNARGPITAPAITNVQWLSSTQLTITGINKADPARVTTSTAHGYNTGDIVYIDGITAGNAWKAINKGYYQITKHSTNNTRFFLDDYDTQGFSGSWSSGGQVQKCIMANCEIVVTSPNHGFANNDKVRIEGVGGTTALNGNTFTVSNVTTNTYVLSGTNGAQKNWDGTYIYSAYTAGGIGDCYKYTCKYYTFTNPYGNSVTHTVSTCVSERVTSPYQYTDTAPATAWVGFNYPSGSNGCLNDQVVPLTSDKDVLHDAIDALNASGSTAGQIGAAWAWYMLAPNFKSLWPTDSQPADYNTANLIKVVVLMTDGSFNSVYCNGVIAQDSTAGSGNASDHISCNATNGNPFDQTKDLCDAMKDDTGIIVYTVGFDIADQSDEKDMLEYCASEPKADHYKLADNADELSAAFAEIAQNIAQLRLSE